MTELKRFQELKSFQKHTVDAVLAAFDRRRRTRRFLVADEVGLGKTLVARHVIEKMMARTGGKPLVVFYICSNMNIARQNRKSLLKILEDDERVSADCPVDRLSLLPASERPVHPKLNLYSLTPDTSLPIRKNRRRDGRQEERALVSALIDKVCPRFLAEYGQNYFQRNALISWEKILEDQKIIVESSRSLREAFKESVRKEFELESGRHLLPVLRRFEGDELKLIAHLRNALAASALEEIKPDLVIFDEFQRFRDLFEDSSDETEEARASQRVIGRLRGENTDNPPALLLLSATPFQMYSSRWEEPAGSYSHSQFFQLVEFLYGGDANATKKMEQCIKAFLSLQDELRKGQPESEVAKKARLDIEEILCPIIARTERAMLDDNWGDYETESISAPIKSDDLAVFKHLVDSFDDAHRSSAVSYWTSIPFPMQTMGRGYIAWRKSRETNNDETPLINEEMRNRFELPEEWPHPRLRALFEKAPPETLALPWLPPTLPWWKLKGAWEKGRQHHKILLFSRFRATPQAIAASLSYSLEARFLSGKKIGYQDVTSRRNLTAKKGSHRIVSLFHPSPFLISSTNPLAAHSRDLRVIRRAIRQQLRTAIAGLGISIDDDAKPFRSDWRLLVRLEAAAGNWDWTSEAWWSINQLVSKGESEDSALSKILDDWDQEAKKPLREINPRDVEILVTYSLGSPGVVIGRSLFRHWPDAVNGSTSLQHVVSASWRGLRTYLDKQWFYRFLCENNEEYPNALLRAVLEGNLEAVLDEHLWAISRLQNSSGAELADELLAGLSLGTGRFFVHPIDGNRCETFPLRCHVAMPFTQMSIKDQKSDEKTDGNEKPMRTDEIRRAFNTPFWPYVLATTSVGQEGLDFHPWCDTVIHWDLCRNPVDLEQREGRIQRFGGLSIRKAIVAAIAKNLGDKVLDELGDKESPWVWLEKTANETMSDDSGLSPWWVCSDGNIKRYIFDVPTSEQAYWLEWVKEQRLLYRLVFGLPHSEDLVDKITRRTKLNSEEVRDAVIQLSPWLRNNKK